MKWTVPTRKIANQIMQQHIAYTDLTKHQVQQLAKPTQGVSHWDIKFKWGRAHSSRKGSGAVAQTIPCQPESWSASSAPMAIAVGGAS